MAAAFLLSGSLEEIPLPDIARLFQSTRKTGRLALASGRSTGSIYFDKGEIVDCQSVNMSGLDALKHVALFNRGSFEFFDGMSPASQTLATYATAELIRFLETRMQESRQLQELMPHEAEIPRYLGGAIPGGMEVSAADLAVALKAAAGTHSVRRLAVELSLDETMVRYTIARYRAAGLMEIVGRDENLPELPEVENNHVPPTNNHHPARPDEVPGGPASHQPHSQPRYWRGRKVED